MWIDANPTTSKQGLKGIAPFLLNFLPRDRQNFSTTSLSRSLHFGIVYFFLNVGNNRLVLHSTITAIIVSKPIWKVKTVKKMLSKSNCHRWSDLEWCNICALCSMLVLLYLLVPSQLLLHSFPFCTYKWSLNWCFGFLLTVTNGLIICLIFP